MVSKSDSRPSGCGFKTRHVLEPPINDRHPPQDIVTLPIATIIIQSVTIGNAILLGS